MSQVYVIKNGQRLGPISFDELRKRTANGEFDPETLVWFQGRDTWVAMAIALPEIAAHAAARAARPPPVPPPKATTPQANLGQVSREDPADNPVHQPPPTAGVDPTADQTAQQNDENLPGSEVAATDSKSGAAAWLGYALVAAVLWFPAIWLANIYGIRSPIEAIHGVGMVRPTKCHFEGARLAGDLFKCVVRNESATLRTPTMGCASFDSEGRVIGTLHRPSEINGIFFEPGEERIVSIFLERGAGVAICSETGDIPRKSEWPKLFPELIEKGLYGKAEISRWWWY